MDKAVQQGGSYAAAAPESKLSPLVQQILSTSSTEELTCLFDKEKAAMYPEEVAILCNHLAKMQSGPLLTKRRVLANMELLNKLTAHVEPHMAQMSAKDFLYMLAAIAKLNYRPSLPWLNRFYFYSKGKLIQCGPGHLSLIIRALSKIDLPNEVMKQPANFKPWIVSFLGCARTRLAHMDPLQLLRTITSLSDFQYKPDRHWLHHFASVVQSKVSFFDSHALGSLMQAFAIFGYTPRREFMRAYYSEVFLKLPLFDDRDLANSVDAFSMLQWSLREDVLHDFLQEVVHKLPTFHNRSVGQLLEAMGRYESRAPPAWCRIMAQHVHEKLWTFAPDSLCQAMWGLARLGAQPTQQMLDEFIKASYNKVKNFKAEHFVMCLSALAMFQYKPGPGVNYDQWFEMLTYAMERKVFHPKDVCEVMETFVVLGNRPDTLIIDELLEQAKFRGLNHAPHGHVTKLIHSLMVLKYRPTTAWLTYFSQIVRYWWTHFTPCQLGIILKSLAQIGWRCNDSPWVTDFLTLLHCIVHRFEHPSEIADVFWGILHLARDLPSFPPSQRWLKDYADRALIVMDKGTSEELVVIAGSLLAMEYQPDPEWWRTFFGQLGAEEGSAMSSPPKASGEQVPLASGTSQSVASASQTVTSDQEEPVAGSSGGSKLSNEAAVDATTHPDAWAGSYPTSVDELIAIMREVCPSKCTDMEPLLGDLQRVTSKAPALGVGQYNLLARETIYL